MDVSISWLRAYHLRLRGTARTHVERLGQTGIVQPVDDQAYEFYDISALLAGHYATGEASPVTLWSGTGAEPLHGRLSVLIHTSGLIVQRLTLDSVAYGAGESANSGLAQIAEFERYPWVPTVRRWRVLDHDVDSSLRGLFNFHYLVLADALRNRPLQLDSYAESAEDTSLGNAHLRELAAAGLLSHPFPVSFGTHVELRHRVLPEPHQLHSMTDEVLRLARGDDRAWAPSGLVDDRATMPWYFFENQSVLHLERPEATPDHGVTQFHLPLLEFLTLRRAALRSVQRDSQRVLTSGDSISKRRIDEWRYLVSTNTDDYVLHDHVSSLMVPLHAHMSRSPLVRDPEKLEFQVRQNVDSFDSRVETAGQSVSSIVGALFAVVAAVVGVGTLVKVGIASWIGVAPATFADVRPWMNGIIDAALMVFAFGLTWLIIRRAGRRLPRYHPYLVRRGRASDRFV